MSLRFPKFGRSRKQTLPDAQPSDSPILPPSTTRSKHIPSTAYPQNYSTTSSTGRSRSARCSSRVDNSPRSLRSHKKEPYASLPHPREKHTIAKTPSKTDHHRSVPTKAEFKHPLYRIKEDGKIGLKPSVKVDDKDLAKHREEMSNAIIQHVHNVMRFELGLQECYIPTSNAEKANSARAKVFVSSNYNTAYKLLVFVATSRGLAPGVWSRGLLLQAGIYAGSMIPYLKQAIKEGYGIIIMNPNKNVVYNSDRTQRIQITGSSTPEEHAKSIWDSYIRPAQARRVYFIGFAHGGVLIKHLLQIRGNELAKRNGAIAFIESSHRIDNDDTPSIKAVLKHRSLYWESSELPFTQKLQGDAPHRTGCTCLSAGRPPRLHMNRYHTAAYCIDKVRGAVFAYLEVRDVKSYLSQMVQTHETTSKIAVTPRKGDQESRGPRNDGPTTSTHSNMDNNGTSNEPTRGCTVCYMQFTLFDRRHHCRVCRHSVCNACSRDRIFLPGSSTAQRVCAECASKNCATTTTHQTLESNHVPHRKQSNESDSKSGESLSSPDHQSSSQVQQTKLCVDDFDLLKVVGKGAFGKVMLVRKKVHDGVGNPNAIYAMKVLKKAAVFAQNQVEHTKSERRILRDIDHPFVVRLRYAFQSENKLYLVMDYYNGGSLFFHLRKSRRFSEKQARFYAAQLVLSMSHLHEYNIAYRDLKLENILMDSEGFIALTDFGLSKENVDVPDGAKTFCGTAEYIAPELLKGLSYGKAVDWWSFGTLLYEMITGQTPFYDRNRKRMFQNILHRDVTFTAAFSEDAKDLLLKLLCRDPAKRLGSGPQGAQEIMDHPFFASIDFDLLLKRELDPPFVPPVKSDADTTNVANVFTKEVAKDSPVTQELGATHRAIAHFEGFTYMPSPQVLS